MKRIVKNPDIRRAEIIKTVRDLFQKKDVAHITMQDVMSTLDIAKGTIYHYFKSKTALLEAVIEDIVEEKFKEIETIISKSKGNALQVFKKIVEAGNFSEDNRNILEYLHHPDHQLMHNRLLAVTLLRQAPLYASLIQKGCEEGLFQSETPLECAEFILSAIQFLTDIGIYPWNKKDLQRRIKAFPSLIEQQLKAPPGSFSFLKHIF